MKSGISSILAVFALAVTLSSCEKEMVQLSFKDDEKAIRIVPEIVSGYVKSNPVTEGKETAFNDGDMIALICGTRHVTFQLSGNDWSPTDNYFLRWTDAPKTYSAFYPATESSASFGNFELQSSQRTADRLAASDYMTCTVQNVQKSADGTLRLAMQRQMAQVCVNLSGVEASKRVQGMRIWTPTGFTEGTPNTDRMYVSPYTVAPENGLSGQDGTKYIAIIVPTSADNAKDFITFNYDGKDYRLLGVPELTAGYRYEMDLNISGSMVSIGAPCVGPWDDAVGVIPGGDASKVPVLPYFVKPQSSGTADGKSWENAFGMTEFLNFIEQKNETQAQSDENGDNANNRTFYFMGGNYSVTPVKVEYSGYPSRVQFNVLGGYSPASTGVDVSDRDIQAYETVFDGNGTNRLFTLGNQVEPTFEGITFSKLKSVGDGCITVAAGGSGDSRVNFTDCKFKSCTASGNTDNSQMPVIFIQKGMVRFDNVVFDACRAEKGVRGLIRLGDTGSRAYLNDTKFVNCTWGGGGYGLMAHLNAPGSSLCLHNVTFANNDTGCSAQGGINGAGGMLIASSTIVASNGHPAIRCESDPNAGSMIVNSIIRHDQDQVAINMPTAGRKLRSYGGNIIIGSKTGDGISGYEASSSEDVYANRSEASVLSFSWDNSYYYWKWNGTTNFSKLTREEVRAAIKTFSNSQTGQIKAGETVVYDGTRAGEDFCEWLDSINAFDTDCYGNTRDVNAFWPGSYQGI